MRHALVDESLDECDEHRGADEPLDDRWQARRASTGGEPPTTAPDAVVSAVSSRGMSASAISSVAMNPIAAALSEQLCKAASAFGSKICSEGAASCWAPLLESELTHLRSPRRAGPSIIR